VSQNRGFMLNRVSALRSESGVVSISAESTLGNRVAFFPELCLESMLITPYNGRVHPSGYRSAGS